jgi:hypothetical protein
LKYGEKLGYEIRNKENVALSKGFITRDVAITNKFLWANDQRNDVHTYSAFAGPVKYKALDGVYMIKWGKSFKREEVVEYLTSKGFNIQYSCEPYIILNEKSKAIEFQKEIIKSKYQIVLLPVILHAQVNEFGWGGGCEYYDNLFSIEFIENVPEERIKSIFKQFGIAGFESQGTKNNGLIGYSFRIQTIIDLQYMELLDELWDLPEVFSLMQHTTGVAGMD